MRLSLRFILPLGVALAVIAYAVVPLFDRLALQWFVRDLDDRSAIVARGLNDRLVDLLRAPSRTRIVGLIEQAVRQERVFALGVCTPEGKLAYASDRYPRSLGCAPTTNATENHIVRLAEGPVHVAVTPLEGERGELGALIVMHDMSFIERRSAETRMYLVYLFAAIAGIVALITVIIAELSWRGWVAGFKALVSGAGTESDAAKSRVPELRPIEADLKSLVRDLEAERSARDESQTSWGPDALRRILREDLKGDEILIVSNREPYLHVRREDNVIEIQRPASGLVTALEPVMRACSGTWIAHGAGSADRDAVDQYDRVMVPPDKPSYRIRRVWLTREEEQGYYYGFANEGLWPLCHIAHARPVFRVEDWEHYKTVNQRFADVVVDEARSEDPIVLVQDYHFALAPRMIRDRLPLATIITFWHIPWPNPEVFGILPWREEVLEGMLGSSILGFHTQFHCNNFFDTVDRFLEARVNRETYTITHGGEPTEVRRYPISIEWPPAALARQASIEECRRRVRERLNLAPDALLGVGVDRLDYTKGILERFLAVERMLELKPQWIGRFSFLQVAAPSRSSLDEYQNLEHRVRAAALRINNRFGRPGYLPIVLQIEHHTAEQVYELYRAAELCYVSSLHDGMNLVAKEFVAARDDEQGVLILSQFTGAARELVEALIVNPYDIQQCAVALDAALSMHPEEQRARMRSMRHLVQEFNVYRWAGRMLIDAARMRHRRRVLSRARSTRLAPTGTHG
ncbi:MAG: trehalose-6-phosphate synthase [Betaproteobacteria bacterium]|jgi:trehalose-6-phosphate synthase|nr:trehalose-6-phosphate synthase [Betaproteobacteria bacterium]